MILLALIAGSLLNGNSFGQEMVAGRLEQLTVHGSALENNLLGYAVERDTIVYLPPSYDRSADRRYPVLYILHGITDPLSVWTVPWSDDEVDYGTIQNLMNRGVAIGKIQDMILVLFDGRTPFFGAHYVNSPVKGNWQDFVIQNLVPFIDSRYRTLNERDSRGIMGHSMGGYGALRFGFDRPDVFSTVYGLSPSVLNWSGDLSTENPAFRILASESEYSEFIDTDFYVGAIIGVSQAFSPRPDHPPYFAEFPFTLQGDMLVPNEPAHSQWESNFLVNRIDAYLAKPVKLNGIRFDAGYADQFSHIPVTAQALSQALTAKGVDHQFELYNGDHRNRLWGKSGRLYSEVLPYFSRLLSGN